MRAKGGKTMKPEQDQFLERLYKAQFSKMLKHAKGKVQNRDVAMDIVQDTFHTAVEKIDILTAHEKPEAWLMKVLNNKIMQYYDRKKEEYTFLVSIEEEDFPEIGEPDQRLEELSGEERDGLKKISAVLTEPELEFFVRLYIDKATHLELAKEYGITVYGSKKKRERIMGKLHEAYPQFRKKKG